MFARISIILISTLLILFLFPTLSFAQSLASQSASVSGQTNYVPFYGPVTPDSPQFTSLLLYNIAHTFSCLMQGRSIIGQPCLEYISKQDSQGKVTSIPVLSSVDLSGGALGITSSMFTALYSNPPSRTIEYLADKGIDLGLINTAHAQVGGAGNNVLLPILDLWKVTRNISYVIMTLIFIVIGIMVMFRNRLNPQTVITVQLALPGLVVGLILITFSYFIASLITDLAFIGSEIVGYYFYLAQATSNPDALSNLGQQNVLSIFSQFIGTTSPGALQNATNQVLTNINGPTAGPFSGSFAGTVLHILIPFLAYQYGTQVGAPFGAVTAGAICGIPALAGGVVAAAPAVIACGTAGSLIGGIAGGLLSGFFAFLFPASAAAIAIWVILFGILFYTMIRLLFKLVVNYLNVILLTVTAPFHFLLASLPGRQDMATAWVLNMLCNVLAFPAVLGVFYFVGFLLGFNSSTDPNFNILRISSQMNIGGGGPLPLFGGLDTQLVRYVLAFGALIASPTVPDIICQTIGRVGKFGQMVEQEVSQAQRSGQGYVGQSIHGIQQPFTHAGGVMGQLGSTSETTAIPGVGTATTTKPGAYSKGRGQGLPKIFGF